MDKRIQLKELYEEHTAMPFPKVTSNDELQDMKGELSLYGGHIAGLVTSYLQNVEIDKSLVTKDDDLEQQFSNFVSMNEEDKVSLSELKIYKHKIDELVDLLSSLI